MDLGNISYLKTPPQYFGGVFFISQAKKAFHTAFERAKKVTSDKICARNFQGNSGISYPPLSSSQNLEVFLKIIPTSSQNLGFMIRKK